MRCIHIHKKTPIRYCQHCGRPFHVDPRVGQLHRFCSRMPCAKASRTIAKKKWLRKAKNREYFRGIAGLENTRNWRQKNPGYWRRKIVIGGKILEGPLADVVHEFALQDMIDTHFYLVAGIISHISKSALQDTIANELRRLIVLGRGILKDTTRAAAWRKFGSRET